MIVQWGILYILVDFDCGGFICVMTMMCFAQRDMERRRRIASQTSSSVVVSQQHHDEQSNAVSLCSMCVCCVYVLCMCVDGNGVARVPSRVIAVRARGRTTVNALIAIARVYTLHTFKTHIHTTTPYSIQPLCGFFVWIGLAVSSSYEYYIAFI